MKDIHQTLFTDFRLEMLRLTIVWEDLAHDYVFRQSLFQYCGQMTTIIEGKLIENMQMYMYVI